MKLNLFRKRAPPQKSAREWSMAPILATGVSAKTIIDVGVADGTPSLYAAFPQAHLLLIEPIVEFAPDIFRAVEGRSWDWVQCGAGSARGTVSIKVFPGRRLQASMFARSDVDGVTPFHRSIPVETIDDIVAERKLPDPLFLKLDAEGAEYEILIGAEKTLPRVTGIITEVSLDNRFGGAVPGLRQIDELLRDKGFGLAAVLDAIVVETPQASVIKTDLYYMRLGTKSVQ